MKRRVAIDKVFVPLLVLTEMSRRYIGVSRNLDRRKRAFRCALRIHVSQPATVGLCQPPSGVTRSTSLGPQVPGSYS